MNQSKFSLADLFNVLATVGFGFFCFLGLNFLSLGKTVPSVAWATVLALILGGLALGAKLLKRTSRNFKACIIWEWVLLFLFTVVAFDAIIPFSHYFVVSEQKHEIQQKVSDCIKQSEDLFDDYQTYAENRINSYERELNNAILKGDNGQYFYPNRYERFQFQKGGNDNEQLRNKVKDLHNGLFENPSSFQAERNKNTAWLEKAEKIMDIWSPISVVDVVSTIAGNLAQWHSNLNERSKFRLKGKDGNVIEEDVEDFNEQELCADDMKKYFTGEYTQDITNMLAICWAIGLYALMLLSYFITKRHTKNNYGLFGKRNSTKSEIDVDY
jgi:hypothetical protein